MVIMTFIISNTLVLALNWFNQPDWMLPVLATLNFTFNIIFAVEAVLKIIAMKSQYFRDAWNIFDFVIVVLTQIFLVLEVTNILSGVGSSTTILRALRIGRILRLIKRAVQLQIIFYTIIDSIAALGSLGLLLLIFFFMFAVIGSSIFGFAKIGEP